MAECAMCGSKVRGRKESVRLGPDKATHCFPCADTWFLEDKKRLITQLYQGDPPAELFCMQKVMILDPHQKTKGLHLGGDLLAIDNICHFIKTPFSGNVLKSKTIRLLYRFQHRHQFF